VQILYGSRPSLAQNLHDNVVAFVSVVPTPKRGGEVCARHVEAIRAGGSLPPAIVAGAVHELQHKCLAHACHVQVGKSSEGEVRGECCSTRHVVDMESALVSRWCWARTLLCRACVTAICVRRSLSSPRGCRNSDPGPLRPGRHPGVWCARSGVVHVVVSGARRCHLRAPSHPRGAAVQIPAPSPRQRT